VRGVRGLTIYGGRLAWLPLRYSPKPQQTDISDGAIMRPEHLERRKIIREWMALPRDKRQTEAQVDAFARKAMGRIAFRRDPYRQIVSWILPRVARQ
jgi:hypothetical protein